MWWLRWPRPRKDEQRQRGRPSRLGQSKKGPKPTSNSEAMMGHVFQLSNKTDNKQQFVSTLDMLKQVMLRDFKDSNNLVALFGNLIADLVISNWTEPERPDYLIMMTQEEKKDAKEDYANARQRYNSQMAATNKQRE